MEYPKNFRNNLIKAVSSIITGICNENVDTENFNDRKYYNYNLFKIAKIKPFLSFKNSKIGIESYFQHLATYTGCEDNTLIIVLIYVDRLCQINKFRLDYFNIQK